MSEADALAGGHPVEMNPVIYYRVSKPVSESSLSKLESFDLAKYFKKEEMGAAARSNQIKFIIKKKEITEKELDIQMTDSAGVDSYINQIFNFKRSEDM